MIALTNTKPTEIFATRNRQHCTRRVGDVSLLVNWEHEFSDEEWRELVGIAEDMAGIYGKYSRTVVFAPSHGPNAAQRAYVKDHEHNVMDEKCARMALITDSAFVRGGVTALSWLMRTKAPMRAFAVKNMGEALAWSCSGSRVDLAVVSDAMAELISYAGYRSVR